MILSQLPFNYNNTYNFHLHKNKMYSFPLGRTSMNYYF